MGCVTSTEDSDGEANDTHELTHSSTSETGRNSKSARWKIFNAIDYRDERERLEFARFVRAVKDALDRPDSELRSSKELVTSISSDLSEMDSPKPVVDGAQVDRVMVEYGVRLPEAFGTGDVKSFIDDLQAGNPVTQATANVILQRVVPVLEAEPNIIQLAAPAASKSAPEESEKITVIGDLHGDLKDLLTILENDGMPTEDHIFVFNGDFVDRGPFSFEVLMVLFALKAAWPTQVYLIRGNHEDFIISETYDFHHEVVEKQGDKVFDKIIKVFALLPLGLLVKDTAFICHGGPPLGEKDTIESINRIPRSKYETILHNYYAMRSPTGSPLEGDTMVDLLWSDPDPEMTEDDDAIVNDERGGCGKMYGRKQIRKWLEKVNAPLLIRSHECVEDGFELHSIGGGLRWCTVFSASGYSGMENGGCTITLDRSKDLSEFHYTTETGEWSQNLKQHVDESVREAILRNRAMVLEVHKRLAYPNDLTPKQWNHVLQESVGGDIPWKELQPTLAPIADGGIIKFDRFMADYEVEALGGIDVTNLYGHAEYLDLLFAHFDTTQAGYITQEEWVVGCEWLNKRLPETHQIKEPLQMFHLIDLNRSGTIDLNELFESFRIGNKEQPALMVASPRSTRKIGPFTPRSPGPGAGGRARSGTVSVSDVNLNEGTIKLERKESTYIDQSYR